MRVAVVGDGIAGTFTAYFLRRAGSEVVGLGGALSYPLGSLVLTLSMPDPRDIELAMESLEIYRSLAHLTPVTSVDILPAGVDLRSLRIAGVRYEVVDGFKGLRLRRGEEVAVITTDYLVPVRRIVKALRRELGFSAAPARLEAEGRTVYAAAGGERVRADAVVLAAGARNLEIASRIGLRLPFRAYSCYAAAYLVPAWLRSLSIGDYVNSWYGRPGPRPLYLAGDGCGEAGSGPPRGYASAIGRLIAARAGWALPLGARSGLCEGSPTGGPLIGRAEAFENLYVVGGLDGYGGMVGPAVARRLADMVLRGSSDILPEASDFDPCRERHDWGSALGAD